MSLTRLSLSALFLTLTASNGFSAAPDRDGEFKPSTPPLGWTAGAGVEYLFTDAISAKIEYLYVNLGTVSCPAGTLCSSDNGEPTNLAKTIPSGSVSFTENLIRAGINYKFSW